MSARAWYVAIVATALTLLVIGLATWLFWPRPDLEGVEELIASGQHDAAEARLLRYLGTFPDDSRARLMLAEASLQRPDPKPNLALGQIVGIQIPDPQFAAQVKAVEGEVRFQQGRYVAAESAWLEALKFDPLVPKVGWWLLNLYALQGRDDETRRLGMRLFPIEPDPHDRVQLLLQLIRHDAHAISPDTVVRSLGPIVKEHPEDHHSALALGRALVRDSQFDAGIALLRRQVESRRDDPEAWEAYLAALVDASRVDTLEQALGELPAAIAETPRFDAARGWIAAQKRDWPVATAAYLRAWKARPTDATLAYRLQTSFRGAGRLDELDRLAPQLMETTTAREHLRVLWDRIDALPDVGRMPHPDLYADAAVTLETLGRHEEAAAWRGLNRTGPGLGP